MRVFCRRPAGTDQINQIHQIQITPYSTYGWGHILSQLDRANYYGFNCPDWVPTYLSDIDRPFLPGSSLFSFRGPGEVRVSIHIDLWTKTELLPGIQRVKCYLSGGAYWNLQLQGADFSLDFTGSMNVDNPDTLIIADPELLAGRIRRLVHWALWSWNMTYEPYTLIMPNEPYGNLSLVERVAILSDLRLRRQKFPPITLTSDFSVRPVCQDTAVYPDEPPQDVLDYWAHSGSLNHLAAEFGLDRTELYRTRRALRDLKALTKL